MTNEQQVRDILAVMGREPSAIRVIQEPLGDRTYEYCVYSDKQVTRELIGQHPTADAAWADALAYAQWWQKDANQQGQRS